MGERCNSPILRIEMDPDESSRWPGADFALFTRMDERQYRPGDVRTYWSCASAEVPDPSSYPPPALAEKITQTLQPGVRALIGNAGCEMTFRHIFANGAGENVETILRWAEWGHGIVGDRLVLAPMDYDLIHDVMTGGRLLAWAAAHGVSLAIFCGYRFLFPGDAFEHIRQVSRRYPLAAFGSPYCFPYVEVSQAIKASGADVWTGAGYIDGLRHGVLEKAAEFGFRGVFTSGEAWRAASAPSASAPATIPSADENARRFWRDRQYDPAALDVNQELAHPHRGLLVHAVLSLEPSSILEIGCGEAANLILLGSARPDCRIAGIEVNQQRLAAAEAAVQRYGLKNVQLLRGCEDRLDSLGEAFDVILTDALLVIYSKERARELLEEMIRRAAKGVVLCEWHQEVSEESLWNDYYAHNYRALAPGSDISMVKIPPPLWSGWWAAYGYVITLRK